MQTSRRTSPRRTSASAKFTGAESTSTMASAKHKPATNLLNPDPKKPRPNYQSVRRNIGYRCASHMIPDIIKQCDPRQKGWISDMGFGTVNEMQECRIPKGMTIWLIHQVDCRTKSLVINGVPYAIKDFIDKILGFCNGNIPVPVPRRGMSKSKPFRGKKDFRSEAAGRGIKLEKAIEDLVKMQDKEEFCRQFIMVFLCVFLAPTSGHILNRSYMDMFKNSEHIKQMNWQEFVVDYLIEGIEEYKHSTVTNVNIHGCVAILPFMYLYIAKSPLIKVPEDSAAICFTTTALLHLLESIDIMPHSSSHNPKYGRLVGHANVEGDIMPNEGTPDSLPADHGHEYSSNLDCTQSAATSSFQTSQSENHKKLLKKIQTLENGYNMRRDKIIKHYENCLQTKLAELDQKKMADMKLLLAEHVPSHTSSLASVSEIGNTNPSILSPTNSTPSMPTRMDNQLVPSQPSSNSYVSDHAQEPVNEECQASKEAAAADISEDGNITRDESEVSCKEFQAAATLTSLLTTWGRTSN